MNERETNSKMPLINNDQRTNLAKILYLARHNTEQIKGRDMELIFDFGKEQVVIVPDKVFFKAVNGGAYGAYKELRQAGEEDYAKQVLRVARVL